MIQTLNHYPNPAKTAEIMSRYRPIAPKPETSPNSSSITDDGSSSSCFPLSQKIKQSPYLRNLWPQMQARPTRTRKRGRVPFTLPPSSSLLKRHKPHNILGFCPPYHHLTSSSPPKNLSLHAFPPQPNHALGVGLLNCTTIEKNNKNNNNTSLVTLPLLPCSPSPTAPPNPCVGEPLVDLNTKVSVPEERDLLQQLQKPVNVSNVNVIQPQPLRPIGSSISVVCTSTEDSTLPLPPPRPPQAQKTPKSPHQLEEEIENEDLPAVISDSNHRIRLANSAFKEMVGQPLCPWLVNVIGDGSLNLNLNHKCKRISGEVTLNLSDSGIPTSSNGFSCWVRIEWQSEHNKKNCVNAFGDVVKLACESRDYLFAWRFHTRNTREASQSSCKA